MEEKYKLNKTFGNYKNYLYISNKLILNMSETLYGEEFNEESLEKELDIAERKQKNESGEHDLDRKYFRQFDYGIDTKDNVIIIEGEIGYAHINFNNRILTRYYVYINIYIYIFLS